MLDSLFEFLRENQFLSGGGVLMIFGALMVALRSLPGRLWHLFTRRFVATYEIRNSDDAFYWLERWLANHPYSKKTRLIWVTTATESEESKNRVENKKGDILIQKTDSRPKFRFSPAPGNHLINHKGTWFYLIREQKEPLSGSGNESLSSLLQQESFEIRTFSWDREHIYDLLEEVRDLVLPPDEMKINIWSTNNYGGWQLASRKPLRSFDSVVLQKGTTETVKKDINRFIESKKWYQALGIPYRRGYLLYGPPGSGKTSLIHAVASEIFSDIYVLTMNSQMNDQKLISLISDVNDGSVLLIEDIDCIFSQRDRRSGKKDSDDLTFSGLLNALDGIASPEGRILFMTTNHIEKLDPALIRPGRVDLKFYFGFANREQAKALFERFYTEFSSELADQFADSLPDKTSMAALQDLLIRNRDDPIKAIETLLDKTNIKE